MSAARLPRSSVAAFVAYLLMAAGAAEAQNYTEDAAIPPGAKGEVLVLRAEVLTLQGQVLEVKGLASGLKARVDPVKAALADLGAKVAAKEIRIDLAADVLFDFDKADLRPAAGPTLEKVAAVLNAHPKASATIGGHTDAKGDDRYNQKLSERRAEAVRRWLAGAGVKTRMTSRGFGETKPVAPNAKPDGSDDPNGRQQNRRVEITVDTR